MKKVIAIIGSGMMGSALAFPVAENGHEVRLVGTHLDRDIIDECRRSNKHPKFDRAFPVGVKYYQIEEYRDEACWVLRKASFFDPKAGYEAIGAKYRTTSASSRLNLMYSLE